ncbi:apolipoprotein D-like [Anopheles aquasalis]|uniref:apolipoprotein D-like n=1 Tax=Anopheles aquasalis TaxID=42839 RepID=UPI00215B058E|nr:apolipoprotein D-like [Anopheles aquasalis]
MKKIADCVILTLMFFLNTFSIGNGAIYTNSCLTFHHSYAFDVEKFLGTWYEQQRVYDPLDPEQEECVGMSYRLLENGTLAIVKSFKKSENGLTSVVGGTAELREPGVPQFYERLNSSNTVDQNKSVSILQTDYEYFAILYSCIPINSTHNQEELSVLHRRRQISFLEKLLLSAFCNSFWKRDVKGGLVHKWRNTEQSPEFCKPSFANETEMANSTEGPDETSNSEVLFETTSDAFTEISNEESTNESSAP